MDIKKIIRLIQVTAVLLIFLGSVIGFLVEIAYMIEIRKELIYCYYLSM